MLTYIWGQITKQGVDAIITNQLATSPLRKDYRLRESVESHLMNQNSGPSNSIDALLQPHYEWLRAKCRYENPKYRDDLFQDVLMRVIKYAKNYDLNDENIRGWLSTMVKNQNKTMMKKINQEAFKRTDNVFTYSGDSGDEGDVFEKMMPKTLWEESPEDVLTAKLDDEVINKALDSLDDEFKDVIRLNMIEGYGYAEIAQMLGIPQNTVGTRISRARKKLRAVLSDVAESYGIGIEDEEK